MSIYEYFINNQALTMDIVTLLESQFCHFLWEEYIMELWIVSVPAPLAGRESRLRGTNGPV